MTEEATTKPRDQAKDTMAISAATMGHDIVAGLLYELRNMPDHWSRLNSDLQQKIIERLKDKTRAAVETAVNLLVRGEFQAVPAKLDYVNRKDGIRAGITINADAVCRHALFDASGGQVLVVIADPKRWMERIDEIKAKGDQLELFNPDANYDPAVDQPGYRRDQDTFIKAGKSWNEMKSSFGVGALPKFEALMADGAPRCQCGVEKTDLQCGLKRDHDGAHVLPDPVVDSSLSTEGDRLVAQRILQEQLAEHGVAVSLGAVQAWDLADFGAVRGWLDSYALDPNTCTIERPAVLPPPEAPPAV